MGNCHNFCVLSSAAFMPTFANDVPGCVNNYCANSWIKVAWQINFAGKFNRA
jgi:hypothetical protein